MPDSPSSAQEFPQIINLFKSEPFKNRVNNLLAEWHVLGFSIAIVSNKKVSSQGFGLASLDPEIPSAVGLLVEDNEKYEAVKWDAKMHDLLPEDSVLNEDSFTEEVTVEDILSHRSGVPGHDDAFFGLRSKTPDSVKTITRKLRHLPISKPLRTEYQYSNTMFAVATHLVETLTGKTFGEFIEKSFLRPSRMSDTHLQPSAVKTAGKEDRLALPYQWSQSEQIFELKKCQEVPETQGAGSIQTSVNDHIRWVQALMHQEGPVTKELYEALTRVRIVQDPDSSPEGRAPFTSFTGYAAGLEVSYYRGHQIIGHDGMITGYSSRHFWMPEFEFGAVMLGNSESAGSVIDVLSKELIDEILEVPMEKRVDWNARAHQVDEEYQAEMDKSIAKELRPDLEYPELLKIPLSAYVGEYWNAGYRGFSIGVRDGKLFVDATERTMGFWLEFEHLADQSVFVVKLRDYYDGLSVERAAEFRFQNDRVVKVGIDFEDDFDGYIWFDKVEQSSE
ncbi:hypothetical protein CB0940_04690 [Cercospora beticola]|uniref:Beta-lactamase/transpeptidase-like protein n=1 Tax=Cercospora beticola TaxID=122368 RepID=A0A2G5HJW0_CERBT|nr:hypothetical protein CB0940_04690 [Cercospora beticola]PIA92846.1 hypothetical protein CB0940_04690 [Cercospora beticola]WPB01951.1 hypothetical protein RHO25_006584 [Cercospora beticola]